MTSQVAIITVVQLKLRGSSGIGFKATEKLLASGVTCIIASRNLDNVNEAVAKLKKVTGRENVEGMKLDLTDPESIHSFVNDFTSKNIPLNILVNSILKNAGIQTPNKVITKAGLESTFSANHLGHFLLTNLLLDKLKASAPSRIVVVASAMHDPTIGIQSRPEMPLEEYNFENKKYDPFSAYRFSKLCNLLFTYELHRRLEGTGVTVNAFCPGFIPATSLGRDYNFILRYLIRGASYLIPSARTLDHGAACVMDLAVGEEGKEGGKYYRDRKEAESSARARDVAQQAALWALSERLIS